MRVGAGLAHDLAEAEGVCVRPLLRRLVDRVTGAESLVTLACGSTRSSVCGPCAEKARRLRMQQCEEGWHLTEEPEGFDEDSDVEREELEPDDEEEPQKPARRIRSTRRRFDVADLPRMPVEDRTLGQTFVGSDGKVWRPSMFTTLTLPSYGSIVRGDGVPADPAAYDYRRAALDAMHFPKLVDRWVQNLRRASGYKIQYFGAVEAQKRLAPHLHVALRGAIPRQVIKQVTYGTYFQLWWPAFDVPRYADELPAWDGENYVDTTTGEILKTWEEALSEIDDAEQPAHVMRFGRQLDIQGITSDSRDSRRAIRYLTKYLSKSIAETYDENRTAARRAHMERLHAEVRLLPCSPNCSNWLRYGIQPQNAMAGMVPGQCPSKAHDEEHLGLGGRRVLVSRRWTGKTLDQHRADRAEVVRQVLAESGVTMHDTKRCAADQIAGDGKPRWRWETVEVTEADYQGVIALAITERRRWREQYERAKAAATGPPPSSDIHSATEGSDVRRAS